MPAAMPMTIVEMKTELSRLTEVGLALGELGTLTPAERDQLEDIDVKATRLARRINDAERDQRLLQIGAGEPGGDMSLADAILEAGFERKTHSAVVIDHRHALEFKEGSVSGGVDGTEVVERFIAPPLGLDARYLYPRVRTQGVAIDETGVQSYRQVSRTPASPTDMVRAIAATTPKPETDTAAEVVAEPLKQIATISTGTPNILLASDRFRSWVNTDLVAAYRGAVDFHIVTEVEAAGIGTGGGGTNAFEDVLYSQEVVRAAGYRPDIVVISPADALAIQLLTLMPESYVFAQQLPAFVITNAVEDGAGFVADSSALGILFLGPFSLQAFEENDGQTNTSTVRAESNGLFLVQRPDAAATLAAS